MLGPLVEELDRLRLDRVCVREVFVQLLVEVVRLDLTQRRLNGTVEVLGEPLGHAALVVADSARGRGDVRLACALGDTTEKLVGRLLERLVGMRMRGQLPRRVRLEARVEDEGLSSGAWSRSRTVR